MAEIGTPSNTVPANSLGGGKVNWDIFLKEFAAVEMAFEKFRLYLEGTHFSLFVDQLPIKQVFEAFGRGKIHRDARIQRWMSKLLCYNFDVFHINGNENFIADHMSRNPAHFQSSTAISIIGAVNVLLVPDEWFHRFPPAYADDPFFANVYDLLQQGQTNDETTQNYSLDTTTTLLYYHDKLCIPHALLQQFLMTQHDSLEGGHCGITNFFNKVDPYYYFPKMRLVIRQYVDLCLQCQRHKPPNRAPNGLLQSFPDPKGRWTDINVDIISGYPEVEFNGRLVNAILTIVCRFSRRVHFYPISTKFSALDFIHVFQHLYMPLHGIPTIITTDRGTQFTSELFQNYMSSLKITSNIAVTSHQQSNGLAETKNKQIERYLRLYIDQNIKWPQLLLIGEYVMNSTPTSALDHKSPFEMDLSYIPRSPATILFPTHSGAQDNAAIDITEKLKRLTTAARHAHKATFQRLKDNYDRRYRDIEFNVGDAILVRTPLLKSHPDAANHGQRRKFLSEFTGPFTIAAKSDNGVNYTLEMPQSYKGHSDFHVSQFRLLKSLPPDAITAPQPKVGFKVHKNGSQLVEIDAIVDHKPRKTGFLLLCRHTPTTKHPDGECVYYSATSLRQTARDLLLAYACEKSLPALVAPKDRHLVTSPQTT